MATTSTSFLVIFFLSHLVLLLSAQEQTYQLPVCSPFSCQNFGNISFPFYDAIPFYDATRPGPGCGLVALNCSADHPTIQLGSDGQWYDLISIQLQPNTTIKIRDQALQQRLDSRSCYSFKNFTLPLLHSPYISFKFFNNFKATFFKCSATPEITPQTDEHFRGKYYSYKQCPGDSFYYSYPQDDHSRLVTDSLPPNCSVIQLPALRQGLNLNFSDPFQVLTAEFLVEWHVSDECSDCHNRGGKCQNDKEHIFLCANAKEERRSYLKVILGTVTSAAGIGFLITVVFCFRRKLALGKSMVFWKKRTNNYHNVQTFLKNYGSLAPKRYSYLDIKNMTNSFKVKLGQGGFGCVYRGKLSTGSLVAVKVLNDSKGDGEEFFNEVASISRTSHVNIVNLLGFCFDGRKRALIYEFMPNGSLEKFIYHGSSSIDRQLGWEKLYQIAIGIARGLEYLHRGCNTRILHFDIKPHNILLDEDFCPKISDFGLAKLCPTKESIISMVIARGTAGYIAPEVFCRNIGGVSHKSDVYSYGMMVLEMVGGRKNIEVVVDHTSEIYFPHWIYNQLKQGEELGLRDISNEEENENARKMVIVSLWCIQTDPSNRPSMTRVVDMLEGSSESLQIPPKPFLSSPSRSPAHSTIEIS